MMSYKRITLLILFLILIVIPSIHALNIGTGGKSFFDTFRVYEELTELKSGQGLVKGSVDSIYVGYKGDGIHKFTIYTQDGPYRVMLNDINVFLRTKEKFPEENIKFEPNFADNTTLLYLNLTELFEKSEIKYLDLDFEYSYNITINKDTQYIKNIGIISSCNACNQSYYKEFTLPLKNEPISKEGARYIHNQWIIRLSQEDLSNTLVYKSIWNFYTWLVASAVLGGIASLIMTFVVRIIAKGGYRMFKQNKTWKKWKKLLAPNPLTNHNILAGLGGAVMGMILVLFRENLFKGISSSIIAIFCFAFTLFIVMICLNVLYNLTLKEKKRSSKKKKPSKK